MTTANAGEGMEKELSYIASWNVKWYSHSGKEFDSFFKKKNNKILLPYDVAITLPGHLSQRNKNLRLLKSLYTNVYSTFICNSSKLAISKTSSIWLNGA